MPQATTTSVALSLIPDLAGPGAQCAVPDTDQPSFDKLLRPAVRHAGIGRAKSGNDSADSTPNLAQPASTEEQLSPFKVVAEGDDPSQLQIESSPTADVLLIESLAGLASITPQIVVVDAPIVTEEGTPSGDQATIDIGDIAPGKSGGQARGAIGELLLNKTGRQAPSVVGEQLSNRSREQAPRLAGEQALNVPEFSAANSAEPAASIPETSVAPIAPIAHVGLSELGYATSNAPASTKPPLAEPQNVQGQIGNPQHPFTASKTATVTAVEVAAIPETASKAKATTTSEQARSAQIVTAVETQNEGTLAQSFTSPARGLTRLERPSSDASRQSATDSHDQTSDDSTPSENPGDSETAAIELAALADNASLQPATAPEATNQAPAVAPAASPPVTTDSHQAAATTSAAITVTSLSAPQIRLPADVLAQPAAATNRRSTSPIDAKGLLTRVARAFAAAQQRDGEIRIRLSPPELGSLRLDVRIQDGVMVAHLQTETDAARTAIIENLPALRDRLSDQGVRIERFDVDLMHRQAGGTPDQPGHQQPEAPLAPLRVAPAPRPRSPAAVVARPSPAAGSTSGLNVIV